LTHAGRFHDAIFQPHVVGKEISVDAWVNRHHRVIGAVLRYRDRVEHGESQITTTFRNATIERECVRTLEALQLRGPVVLQALLDSSGGVHVIEVNARFGGASTAGIAAGLDPWYWSLVELQGGEITTGDFRRVSGEIRQVRLPGDFIEHVSHLRS
jgi:carbamoyl-phosphate synthase large subunit